MKLPKCFTLPKRHHRQQSKARSEISPAGGRNKVDPATPRRTESTPDPRPGASTLPTSGPLAPCDQEPNKLPTVSNQIPLVPGSVLGRDQGSLPKPPDNTVDIGVAPESKSDWKSTAYATTKLAINLVKESSDAFPPLKSVVGGLSAILDHCDKTVACRQTIELLMPRVEQLAESLSGPVPEGEVREEERRSNLKRELDNILQELGSLEQRGKVTRFLNGTKDADKLSGLVEDIRDAMMDYQTSLQQDIYDKGCRLIERADLTLLRGMYHTADAGHLCGDRQGCMKGTRRDVLFQIERWLNDEEDKRVFWLNGLAGTGKSTITQTFAETSFADGKLGASFFCSRDFDDRSNLRTIFPTLAFQLAHRYPRFRQELLPVLTASPDVGKETLCSQMEKLIVGPLRTTGTRTLIIIDALDECQDKEPASALLSVLSRFVDKIPFIKFFITGRPEPRIRSGFRLESLRPHTDVLRLHDVERCSVDSDIKLFLNARLSDIARNRSNCELAQDWPNPQDVNILCKKAAGFFIYASTVVKFVASEYHPSDERLTLVVSLPQDSSHEGKAGTDLLYTQVLEQAFQMVDQGFYSHLKSVLGAVLLIFHPLSIKTLSDLLGSCGTPSKIYSTLRGFHSLLLIPDSTEDPVRIFHKSFPDFLTDLGRCTDQRFFIDSPVHHREVVLACLNVMNGRLKKNICELDDHVVLSEVEDLDTRKRTYIGDTLEYACCFWAKHLARAAASGLDVGEVYEAIDKFFTTCFLFWVEVLSLMRDLDTGVYALNDIQQWYALTGVPCKWTNDSQRFLLENFDTISKAPSQIYHFALPFSPSSSWLRKCYGAEFSHTIRVVKGLSSVWGACFRTVSLSGGPMALSHWENTIAVGCMDSDIIILDAITGSQMAILSEHTGQVNSVTFSSDGRSLASGSDDKNVKLWDLQTGGAVKTFYGHSDDVYSVSISQDCTRIASGSGDNTICLWDIQTGECLHTIKQQSAVKYVTFSPIDPQCVISISGEKVWEWNIHSQQISSSYDATHLAFSPDHTQLAFCCGGTVTVQNFNSGEIVAQSNTANKRISYCCFSPDGKFIAAAADRTAYVWDITSSDCCLIETFVDHISYMFALAFPSPSSLISASEYGSVEFWQIGALLKNQTATDPESTLLTSPPILSVSLQTKAGIAISSDKAGIVKTWDLLTGNHKASFPTPVGDCDWRDVQLIGDRLIIVWHKDSQIYIWDTSKNELLQTIDSLSSELRGLRISGDGSKVFCLTETSIQAWSIDTGEHMGEIELELGGRWYLDPLQMDGSRIWIRLEDLSTQGWDFGTSSSSHTPLSIGSTGRPLQDFGNYGWQTLNPSWIKGTISGKEVFKLPGRHASPGEVQWDEQYLIAGYESGELLILDFHNMYLQ